MLPRAGQHIFLGSTSVYHSNHVGINRQDDIEIVLEVPGFGPPLRLFRLVQEAWHAGTGVAYVEMQVQPGVWEPVRFDLTVKNYGPQVGVLPPPGNNLQPFEIIPGVWQDWNGRWIYCYRTWQSCLMHIERADHGLFLYFTKATAQVAAQPRFLDILYFKPQLQHSRSGRTALVIW